MKASPLILYIILIIVFVILVYSMLTGTKNLNLAINSINDAKKDINIVKLEIERTQKAISESLNSIKIAEINLKMLISERDSLDIVTRLKKETNKKEIAILNGKMQIEKSKRDSLRREAKIFEQ